VPTDSDYESINDVENGVEKWNKEVTEEDYQIMLKEHKESQKKMRQVGLYGIYFSISPFLSLPPPSVSPFVSISTF
jgi:hypothetical protein